MNLKSLRHFLFLLFPLLFAAEVDGWGLPQETTIAVIGIGYLVWMMAGIIETEN